MSAAPESESGLRPGCAAGCHVRRIVHAKAEGAITLAEIRAHLEEESNAGGLPYRELIDACGYRPAFSSQEVRTLVAVLRGLGEGSRLGPTAVIVDSDVGFGMLRMLEMLVLDVCLVRPFRGRAEAERWLAQVS